MGAIIIMIGNSTRHWLKQALIDAQITTNLSSTSIELLPMIFSMAIMFHGFLFILAGIREIKRRSGLSFTWKDDSDVVKQVEEVEEVEEIEEVKDKNELGLSRSQQL